MLAPSRLWQVTEYLTVFKSRSIVGAMPGSDASATGPSRRERRRQETLTEIKRAAVRQLAEGGVGAISTRAIAREIGTTASGVNYYFPVRQALLDAMITDGFDDLAGALRDARDAHAGERPDVLWLAICRAHRAWALAQPARYLLLYGNDGGGAAKDRNPAVRAAFRGAVDVLFTAMQVAVGAEQLDLSPVEELMPRRLGKQLGQWRAGRPPTHGLPESALAACLIMYAQLHGAITLEIADHIPPAVQDRQALFELEMTHAYNALLARSSLGRR